MAERVRVREIDDDEGRRLLRIVRRGTGSVVTWRRAQMVLLSAQGVPVVKIAELTNADVLTFVDKAYQGAAGSVRTPFKRQRYRPNLSHGKGREQGPRPDPLTRRTCRGHPQVVVNPAKDENPQPCRPTQVMSCRGRTRHTYDGTRRDGGMT